MYFKLSIVMSSLSMSAISFTCPNRFRAPRVTSIAWCRKGHLFVLTIVHQRLRNKNDIHVYVLIHDGLDPMYRAYSVIGKAGPYHHTTPYMLYGPCGVLGLKFRVLWTSEIRSGSFSTKHNHLALT